MFKIGLGILIRIISNSYLNVFQKLLTSNGVKSSVVNFYTYLGLSVLGFFMFGYFSLAPSSDLIINTIIMGILGALGNYFIIKALSVGELSTVAPINSYKPIVAMIIAFLYLGEIPSLSAFIGITLIILGTYFILKSDRNSNGRAIFYRFLALVFSGSEAVFIKKIIILTNIPTSFFLWAISGFLFASLFLISGKHLPKLPPIKEQVLLILCVGIMQFATNYVFAKMNVSYALALFQLSTLLSVFLGINIFKEKNFLQKIIASTIMVTGAIIIILTA